MYVVSMRKLVACLPWALFVSAFPTHTPQALPIVNLGYVSTPTTGDE